MNLSLTIMSQTLKAHNFQFSSVMFLYMRNKLKMRQKKTRFSNDARKLATKIERSIEIKQKPKVMLVLLLSSTGRNRKF